MDWLITLPFLLQSVIITLDEYFFHIKRGLPKWERIGHPLDTLTVLLCFGYVLYFPFSTLHLKIYIGLALFSCLFVTKDEFIHKDCCPASEQWLHAFLFLNHPVLLTATALIWPLLHNQEAPHWLQRQLTDPLFLRRFLLLQAVFAGLFCLYQTLYWNFIWKEKQIKDR